MTNQVPGGPPPGWYDDPEGKPGLRWWNGTQWTEDRAPSLPPGASSGGGVRTDGLRDVGDWLNQTFRIAKERAGHLFTMVVALGLPIGLLTAFAIWRFFQNWVIDIDNSEIIWPEVADWILMGVAVALAAFSALTMSAAMTRQTMAAYIDRPEPWSKSLIDGLAQVPRLFGNYLLVFLAVAVVLVAGIALVVVSGVLGLLVLLVVIVGGGIWLIARVALLTPAAVCSPKGEVGAIRNSLALSKGIAAALLGRVLVLGLVGIGVALAGSVLNAPFSPAIDAASFDENTEVIVFSDFLGDNFALLGISQVISTLINGISSALSAAGLSILYKDRGGAVDPNLGLDPVIS